MEKLMEWQIADEMAGYANQFFGSLHTEEQVQMPQQGEATNSDTDLFNRFLDTNGAGVSGESENGGTIGHDDELFTDHQPGADEDVPTAL